jgi:GT2 family glycosyltransferase
VSKFPHDVSVVIVAHNALNCLPATLESLQKAGCPATQITVIDVASSDGGPDWITSQWLDVRVLRLGSNNGPGPARNLGITNAKTPYVLLMDADVIIESDTIPLLRSAIAEDPSIGIATPVIVYADRPSTIQYAGTALHFICEAVNLWQGRSLCERGSEWRDIGCASGSTLLISRAAAIQVGLFDERYFMGKEDGEFVHRIKLAGYKVLEIPQARVLHNGRPRGTDLFCYQIRNRWHFMLKNYQIRTLVMLVPALFIHEVLQLVFLIYKGHGIAYLRAILSLTKMLPNLKADRVKVAKFRVRQDYEVLVSNPIVVREDLLSNFCIRRGKVLYDNILQLYWNLLRKTVLHR